MKELAIEVEPRRTLAVLGSDAAFPVRRVYCIGRNYAAHAREMGHNPDKEPPFFFMKAADAILPVPAGVTVDLPYPQATSDFHHEVELVAALRSGGSDIPEARALDCVFGYSVGLDMTRRDLQNEAKKLARPWDVSKAADHSGPSGVLTTVAQCGHLAGAQMMLTVNGAIRQETALANMIWSVAEQIAILSRYFELKAGDVIFTGTPEGVASVKRGDALAASVTGLTPISLKVV